MFLKTAFLNTLLATGIVSHRCASSCVNSTFKHTCHTHSTLVQPYFLSLKTDKQNVPSYWLKNIPNYSETKKKLTNPATKQSTIKTVFIPAINSSPSDLQLRALRRRVNWYTVLDVSKQTVSY